MAWTHDPRVLLVVALSSSLVACHAGLGIRTVKDSSIEDPTVDGVAEKSNADVTIPRGPDSQDDDGRNPAAESSLVDGPIDDAIDGARSDVAWGPDGHVDGNPNLMDGPIIDGAIDGASADQATGTDGNDGGDSDAMPVDAEVASCSTDGDCPTAYFCFYDLSLVPIKYCPGSSNRATLTTPGTCLPLPCGGAGCIGKPCTTYLDCEPSESCGIPTGQLPPKNCVYGGHCTSLVSCSADCLKVTPPYTGCDICLCPKC